MQYDCDICLRSVKLLYTFQLGSSHGNDVWMCIIDSDSTVYQEVTINYIPCCTKDSQFIDRLSAAPKYFIQRKQLQFSRLHSHCELWSLPQFGKAQAGMKAKSSASTSSLIAACTLIHLAIASSFPDLVGGHDFTQMTLRTWNQVAEPSSNFQGETNGLMVFLWLMVLVGMATTIFRLSNLSHRCWRYGFMATMYYLLNVRTHAQVQTDDMDDFQEITVAKDFRDRLNTEVFHWNPNCRKRRVINHPATLRQCSYCKTD